MPVIEPSDQEKVRRVLTRWFGDISKPAYESWWFRADTQIDAALRAEFGDWVRAALAAQLERWRLDGAGRLALVLLLDQLPRNLYRGTAAAFAGDTQALGVAASALAAGDDLNQDLYRCAFLYMPFQHAEDLDLQDQGIELYSALVHRSNTADEQNRARQFLRSAQVHRQIIRRFGRFPHRNAVLGRDSSAAELVYLRQNPAAFGQPPARDSSHA